MVFKLNLQVTALNYPHYLTHAATPVAHKAYLFPSP